MGAFDSLIAACALLFVTQPALALSPLDGKCAARADCMDGLRCVRNVCVGETTYRELRDDAETDPRGDSNTTHAYVGGVLGAALPAFFVSAGEAYQLALRVGLLLDGHAQFQLEVSPASTVLVNETSSAYGFFDVVGSVGYLIPITPMASWIVRAGGGGGAVFGPTIPALAFAELRIDVFGVAVKTGKHVMIEFNAPSFRVMFMQPFNQPSADVNANVLLMWVANVAVNYLF